MAVSSRGHRSSDVEQGCSLADNSQGMFFGRCCAHLKTRDAQPQHPVHQVHLAGELCDAVLHLHDAASSAHLSTSVLSPPQPKCMYGEPLLSLTRCLKALKDARPVLNAQQQQCSGASSTCRRVFISRK